MLAGGKLLVQTLIGHRDLVDQGEIVFTLVVAQREIAAVLFTGKRDHLGGGRMLPVPCMHGSDQTKIAIIEQNS